MIFSKFLVEVLGKLSNDVSTEIREENKNYPYILDWAVRSWCRKLNLPSDAVINILQEDELKEFTSEIWAKWQQKSGFLNSEDGELKKYINKKLGKTMNRNINTLEFILLFALVMAGIGYVLHLVNQQSKENKDRISKIPSIPSLPHIEKKKEGWTLILVINAEKETTIRFLQSEHHFVQSKCEELYRATQALWIGTESDFSASQLKNWFSYKSSIPDNESSEYDVHLVQIQLDRYEPGFQRNVTSIERRDAFLRLSNNSGKVTVSPRLSCKAYENTLYRC